MKIEKTREVFGEEAFDARLYFIGPRKQRTTPMRIKIPSARKRSLDFLKAPILKYTRLFLFIAAIQYQ